MRFLTSKHFLNILANVAFVVACSFSAGASAQVGISCDPDTRVNNEACPNGNCRRVGGSCGLFNWMCIDDSNSAAQTAWGPGVCASFCSNSTGLCESNVTPCNSDIDCDQRESCLVGVCSVGDCLQDSDCDGNEICGFRNRCTTLPPPECSVDTDCGANELCFGEQCVLGNCRGNFECRTDEACVDNQCTDRCPEGETWVSNPIGFPPIPLGRCQADESLISCCYEDNNPIPLCVAGESTCPVNSVCAINNVCFDLCGPGPCLRELPRRPRDLPPPERWLDLAPQNRPTTDKLIDL